MRIYDYMKGILGAMGVGEDVGVPEPSWRIEEYLKAIYDKLKEGGGGSSSNLFVVNVTLNQSYSLVADKTYAEISAAIDAGKQVVCVRSGAVYTFASKTSSNIYFAELHPNVSVLYISISSSNNVITKTQHQLSSTSAQDNGSEMIVKNGAWNMQKKKFTVTLTPTSPDYSGTMDKTPEEITAAYNAGQEIEFDVPSLSVKCKAMEFAVNDGIIQAGAIATYRSNGSHLLIEMLTHSTASEYFTSVYTLTPAS